MKDDRRFIQYIDGRSWGKKILKGDFVVSIFIGMVVRERWRWVERERIVDCGEVIFKSKGDRKREDEFYVLCVC